MTVLQLMMIKNFCYRWLAEGIPVALFFSRKIIEIINQAADHQRIFILCENVQNAAELVKSGLSIKSVNPGNLGVPSPVSLEQTLRATAKPLIFLPGARVARVLG
jgi:mannose/fructose/N-acetylgalactosamine-specific phosphotransferase system component IIB